MFGKTKQLENQVKRLQEIVADRDATVKRLSQTLGETQDLERQARRQRDASLQHSADLRAENAHLSAQCSQPDSDSAPETVTPRVPVTDVAIKTAGLVTGDDVLVGSDGFSFWEVGRSADLIARSDGNSSALRLVKR